MKIGNFDTDKQVFIVAEIGNNHEGSYSLAEEMIGLAAKAGADAVKFQTFVPEKLVSKDNEARLRQLNRFKLTYEQFEKLKKVADHENIMFLSTPFDIESAQFLNGLLPAYKIASGDNTFYPLIETIARTGKPIMLSSGMTALDDLQNTINHIYAIWGLKGIDGGNLALLHCVVNYPVAPENANLLFINKLICLGVTVGYSDHTIGTEAAVLSVALGARIIEKHFTIDSNYSDFHDHAISADPKEFTTLVEKVRSTLVFMGDGNKRVLKSEEGMVRNIRRSIVAAHDLMEGTILALSDLTWVRPGIGLKPGDEHFLIGKVLRRKVRFGEPLLITDVEE